MFHSPESPSPTRILLVEAHLPIRQLCVALLERAGYRVDVQAAANAGWEALRESGYDLLVIDHELPGCSGLRLTARIRNAHVTLPVILIVESGVAAELERNPRLGISATLDRLFTAEQLLETAVAVLESAHSAPELGDWSPALICCEA